MVGTPIYVHMIKRLFLSEKKSLFTYNNTVYLRPLYTNILLSYILEPSMKVKPLKSGIINLICSQKHILLYFS